MAKGIRSIWIDSDSVGVLGTKVYRDDVLIATVPFGTLKYDDPTAEVGVQYKYVTQAYTVDSESTSETLGVNMDYYTIGAVTALTPIMTNFRVEEANKDRIYFDTPLGAVTGIDAADFTITDKTISAVDTTANYFTVTADFTHWSNHTIRKGGTDTTVWNFDLQFINNNIDEPIAATPKYVTVSGGGDGSSLGSPWTLAQACSNAAAGDHVHIEKGTYVGNFAPVGTGTINNPIIFEGYNITPGDSPTLVRTPTTVLDDSVMPFLDGSGSGDGFKLSLSSDYFIVRNMAASDYENCFDIGGGAPIGIVFDNLYARGSGAFGVSSIEFYRSNSEDCTVKNCYASDAPSIGLRAGGQRTLIDNCYVSSNGVVSMDYYISHQGSSIGDGNGIIRNCEVVRDPVDSHSGHGISLRGNGIKVEYTLVEDCTIDYVGSAIELRTDWVKNCVVRDVTVNNHGWTDWTFQAIRITGARDNIIDNLVSIDNEYFVQFIGSIESEEYGVIPVDTGYNNTFKNCIGYRTDSGTSTQIVINNETKAGATRSPQQNTFINCTFLNFNRSIYYVNDSNLANDPDIGNSFINCIINDVPTEQVNATNQSSQWAYNYVNYYNSFTPPIGANNFNVNPQLDANFQPQATFTDIDVPRIDGVYYGKNGNERQDPTTVGSVLSAEEIPSEPPSEYDFYVSLSGDNSDGLTEATAWDSLASLQSNLGSLSAGDVVGFNGGDEFFGNLTLNGINGASGNPITFTSYGTGKAVIKGTKAITGSWTNEGGNVWSISTGADTVYQVFKDGEFLTPSRLPEIVGDYARAANFLNTSSLIGHNDITGGSVHYKVDAWTMETEIITGFNSSTGDITTATQTVSGGEVIVSNHENLLTVQDYWSYDANVLKMYSTTEPTGIEISTVDGNGIDIPTGRSYLTIDNLIIQGFNQSGIYPAGADYISITNTDFKHNRAHHVFYVDFGQTLNTQWVDGCTFVGGDAGVRIQVPGVNITNSIFTNIGVQKYMTPQGFAYAVGVKPSSKATFNVVNDNKFYNMGNNAISFLAPDGQAKRNYIEEWSLTVHDAGAIHSWSITEGSPGVNRLVVDQNTIINDTDIGGWTVVGIYFDDNSEDTTATNNNVKGGSHSHYLHNSNETVTTNNKYYGAGQFSLLGVESSLGGEAEMINNDVTYNQFYTNKAGAMNAYLYTTYTTMLNITDLDHNIYYCPTADMLRARHDLPSYVSNDYTLAQWQAYSGQDLNSTSDLTLLQSQFVYNETSEAKVIALVGEWRDLTGTLYTDEITLQPYSSEILLEEGVDPLGPELVINGDMSSATGWTLGSSWTISGGKLNYDGVANQYANQLGIIEVGKEYQVEIDLDAMTADNTVTIFTGWGAGEYKTLKVTDVGGKVITTILAGSENIGLNGDVVGTSICDNFSVKEILNPANYDGTTNFNDTNNY